MPVTALACLLAGAAGVSVVYAHRRRTRGAGDGRGRDAVALAVQPVAHRGARPSPRRAMRAAARACGLTWREARQVRRLAAEQGWASPAVGLLCPSLIDAALPATRADRRVLAGVASKARAA